MQVLSLKGIQFTITDRDFDAIAGLEELQEIVLDCDQPPEGQGQTDEAKWGLLHFPEAMKQLTNMTHLTLSCHYGITALPQGISRLNKLEVGLPDQLTWIWFTNICRITLHVWHVMSHWQLELSNSETLQSQTLYSGRQLYQLGLNCFTAPTSRVTHDLCHSVCVRGT